MSQQTFSPEVKQRYKEIRRARRIRAVIGGLLFLAVMALFYRALIAVEMTVAQYIRYGPQFLGALEQYFPVTTVNGVPVLDVGQYWEFIIDRNLFGQAGITLAMGFAGTIMGFPLALLFSVLGSGRVTPFPFNFLFRGVMSSIRAIPALVWALIYVPLGGVTPFTATLAIATDTIGNLGRLFTDELEEIESGPIEAIQTTGAGRIQVIVFGMLSQVTTPFIAWTLYILEINIRIAVSLGIIGGGGIGYTLAVQQRLFEYTNMMATILVILVLIISVEMFSQRVRSYIRAEEEPMGLWELLKGFPRRMAESLAK
ncbi:phosphonate ABC transporter, permease protein PhnE [Natronosalvus halobius]|uniref:phosphonate ABC transporter, permease protein PhnE n=1 Tax=Natronosalvus halobius TaxID=2953746 RepID=UPI00209DA9B2|nr:phosphonate ABC transporter, permease protein PhnE [Natronosalvus halobius]USZ70271.1 phosphonate ABC transporter, permease protein PhnE [Natronosalvus halobius]